MKLNWNPPEVNPITARFTNEAPHALKVHELDETPRPWMIRAIVEQDVTDIFKEFYNGDIESTFRETCEALHGNMLSLIVDDVWEWNGVTYRKNGEVVGSPRNIYDTGELYESQKLEIE